MLITNGRVIVEGISFGNVFTRFVVRPRTPCSPYRRRGVGVPAAADPASLPQGAESARRARGAFTQPTLASRFPGHRRLVAVAVIDTGAPAHCGRADRRLTESARLRNRSGAESFDRSIDCLKFVMRRREKGAGRFVAGCFRRRPGI